jgi:hypothetical protein
MSIESSGVIWRLAEALDDLCRRLDVAEREATAGEPLARPRLPAQPVPARLDSRV